MFRWRSTQMSRTVYECIEKFTILCAYIFISKEELFNKQLRDVSLCGHDTKAIYIYTACPKSLQTIIVNTYLDALKEQLEKPHPNVIFQQDGAPPHPRIFK